MIPGVVRRLTKTLNRCSALKSNVRGLASAYEGDGKTTVRILNQDADVGLMVDAFGTYGFKLNNGITVLGPMAIFARTVMSWQVPGAHAVTPEALQLFAMLAPNIDLLVIGVETTDRRTIDAVHLAAKAASINVEILQTEHACTTFNFLNAEGRSVAGALIPPLSVNQNEDDMLQTKLHYDNLYKNPNFHK